MAKLTIDGREITVEAGTKVIEAAERLGIFVPRYCYHPGLSIAGNCRICMVEIEKFPKTQIACNTDCLDGMVVRTDSDKAKETRRHILEFLLANHPLDCPVCDQAGECWLQDYYMKFGLYDGRFYEEKVKKQKAVSIGPTVMLDAERCILCSRCVRFSDEITKTSELGIVSRGDHSEIAVHPDRELDNKYSGNVVDICPVGALTDKDFRFKCRVWYLKSADSICPGCARGCNIQIHYNTDRPQHGSGERVMRLKPRENPEVNQWWICDAGRYGYKSIDHNRIERPVVRKPDAVQEMDWPQILDEAARKIREAKGKIGVFVSPQLSNEELSLTRKLFSGDRFQTFLFSPNPEGDQDDFLIRSDKNPNTKGAELMGFKSTGVEALFKECEEGKIEGLLIFGQDLLSLLDPRRVEPALNDLLWTVFIGPHHNLMSEAASYVLPSAVYAEKNGTFTNFQGKVQKFNQALEPLGQSRPEGEILKDLADRLGVKLSLAATG
ncbi:MAG: (2Fe-2S)-binding protein [Candidatus Omnitrophica bacterium]|nr:(2Fe-2S)-binding protein [Candidatus Omnitrophota bacterium]